MARELTREALSTYALRYRELNRRGQEVQRSVRHLSGSVLQSLLRSHAIVKLDGQLCELLHSTSDLRQDLAMFRASSVSRLDAKARQNADVLAENVNMLLEALESLHRLNTHSNVIFAIGLGLISLVISIFPLIGSVAGHVTTWLSTSGGGAFLLAVMHPAAVYFLVALAISLVYSLFRFACFTHAALFPLGAYVAWLLKVGCGLPLWLAFLFAVVVVGGSGYILHKSVYQRLIRQASSPLILMLASLGLYVALLNALSLCFGDDPLRIRASIVTRGVSFCGAYVTQVQVLTLLVGSLVALGFGIFLPRGRFWLQFRAVADQPGLAVIGGVDCDRLGTAITVLSSALVGAAGVLVALDVDAVPTMGMNYFLVGFVVLLIVEKPLIWGLLCGAVAVSFCQQLAVLTVGPRWAMTSTFVALMAFLVVRSLMRSGVRKWE